jgi:hypothetical protein
VSKDADCHCGGRHAWLTRHRNAKPSSVISMDFCYDRRIISEPAQLGDMKWNLSGIRYISLVSRWPYDTNACEVRRETGLSRGELTTDALPCGENVPAQKQTIHQVEMSVDTGCLDLCVV